MSEYESCPGDIRDIVPVYKVEEYLPQCVDSILVQTFTNFELLLVDDGSPDRCGEICGESMPERIRGYRVFHQQNSGVSAARNIGLQHAKGTYIVFVDSDDWVSTDYLLHLYKSLPDTGIGLVMGGALKYSIDGKLIGKITLPEIFIGSNIGEGFAEYGLDRFGFSCFKTI